MEIRQGDLFWVDLGRPSGSEPGYKRPYLVIQNNLLNKSGLNTAIVCALTTNLKWAYSPGNVLLNKGEANLSRKSVVNVTQIFTVDRQSLRENIGRLSSMRFAQVLEGIDLVLSPREPD